MKMLINDVKQSGYNGTRMTQRRTILVMLIMANALLLASGCRARRSEGDEIAAIVNEMISLLEAGEYEKMILNYCHPDEVRHSKSEGTFEGRVAEFRAGKYVRLLDALRQTREITHLLSDDRRIATFDSESLPMPMRFEKVGARWYLLQQ